MTSKKLSGLGCMAFIIGIPIIFLYTTFTLGFVFSTMWGWFIVPLGVPELSWLHAYGICLMFFLLNIKSSIHKSDNKEVDYGKVGGLLISPWLSLLIAYFVHLYV